MRHSILLLAIMCCGCTARSMPQQNFYVYEGADVLRYLQHHGFPADHFRIAGKSRNGTRVIVREVHAGREGAFWTLDAADDLPRRLDWPIHKRVWLDANAEIAAWTDSLGQDGLHLSDGQTKPYAPEPFIKFGISQYAEFFYVQDRATGVTEVYESRKPEKPAFVMHTSWDEYPDFIYTYSNEVYLVSYGNLDKANCSIFRTGPDDYVKVRQTKIPGWIREIDPTSGLLLISTSWDWPLTGFMYLFDEKSGQKTSVGYSRNTVELFLARDFLSERLARR